ncbi:aldo/keto reductase [Actinosynnema pretiosum subsp. pretiosum]|uniref:Aldo/keto reductase n=1 Tax=Actinosynnema pretiosum subsp. pretiosum TaxID=103721 RepID=A0AA45L9N7_9PSEU|nr:aldo/keto reductase [Actinosynnema pretiosum subsp. pretiosum]
MWGAVVGWGWVERPPDGVVWEEIVAGNYRALAAGVEIPLLGFGTYLIPDEQAADAVETAIRAGYRHIDTAEAYGNERGVGEGIRRGLAAVGIGRDELFVTTKLFPGVGGVFKSAREVEAAFEASLSALGVEYVDLYLIHAPFTPEQRLEQWGAVVGLHESGRARAVGVSNFNVGHIEELVAAGLPLPHANQIELHPWSQKPEIVRFLEGNGIVPIAYSSLVPLSTWRAAPGHASGKTDEMRADGESGDSPFKAMAAKHGVSEAQVLLRWGVQSGYPVLPKSTDPARIRENAEVFSFELDEEDMRVIAGLDRGAGVAWRTGDPVNNA